MSGREGPDFTKDEIAQKCRSLIAAKEINPSLVDDMSVLYYASLRREGEESMQPVISELEKKHRMLREEMFSTHMALHLIEAGPFYNHLQECQILDFRCPHCNTSHGWGLADLSTGADCMSFNCTSSECRNRDHAKCQWLAKSEQNRDTRYTLGYPVPPKSNTSICFLCGEEPESDDCPWNAHNHVTKCIFRPEQMDQYYITNGGDQSLVEESIIPRRVQWCLVKYLLGSTPRFLARPVLLENLAVLLKESAGVEMDWLIPKQLDFDIPPTSILLLMQRSIYSARTLYEVRLDVDTPMKIASVRAIVEEHLRTRFWTCTETDETPLLITPKNDEAINTVVNEMAFRLAQRLPGEQARMEQAVNDLAARMEEPSAMLTDSSKHPLSKNDPRHPFFAPTELLYPPERYRSRSEFERIVRKHNCEFEVGAHNLTMVGPSEAVKKAQEDLVRAVRWKKALWLVFQQHRIAEEILKDPTLQLDDSLSDRFSKTSGSMAAADALMRSKRSILDGLWTEKMGSELHKHYVRCLNGCKDDDERFDREERWRELKETDWECTDWTWTWGPLHTEELGRWLESVQESGSSSSPIIIELD
jgi:hypothetical protein